MFPILAQAALPSRQMERLARATTAIQTAGGILVTWRIFGPEWPATTYNVYRDGTRINSTPLTGNSNWLDPHGKASSTYAVRAVVKGIEEPGSPPAAVQPAFFRELIVKPRENYRLDDVSTGDLDGDGNLELIVKRVPSGPANIGKNGFIIGPDPVFLEAYKLDGAFLWEINLGPNANYPIEIQFIVYDLDGDGRAEIACQTHDGTVDGTGIQFGDTDRDGTIDYRRPGVSAYIGAGPEYFSVFEGKTGRELARAPFISRGSDPQAWGDNYWHRATKFLWAAAYFDGQRPSLFFSRGYYALTKMEAWDFRAGKLSRRWTFSSATPGNEAYAGQGNHQLSVGDVTGDGRDEILYGAACISPDGKGLYSTRLGHGDAMHLSDMDPSRPGLELWNVHEAGGPNQGGAFRDARTGDIIWGWDTKRGDDTGRGLAAHIDARYPGFQFWSSSRAGLYTITNEKISDQRPSYVNAIYWSGALQRELLDGQKLERWDGDGLSRVLSLWQHAQAHSIGGTKNHPCLQADLYGDWREEIVMRSKDETRLVIFSANTVTDNRFYTFMHDPVYRLAIAWQMNTYNQPPHVSFYIGTGMGAVPAPRLYYAPASP